MKKYGFWTALFLIGVVWIVNIVIFHKAKLEEPIVLKHYIERPMEQAHYFRIYYLANKNNPAILQSMVLEGLALPNISSSNDMWQVGNQNSIYNSSAVVQEFNHYLLLEAQFDPSMIIPEESGPQSFTWERVLLSFSDGTSKEFDLGEIKLTPFDMQKSKLTSVFSGSSSNGFQSSMYSAEEPMQLNELRVPSAIEEDVLVKVQYKMETWETTEAAFNSGIMPDWDSMEGFDTKDLAWPIQMEADDKVSLHMQVNPTASKAIDAMLAFVGETADGEAVSVPVSIQHIPHLTDDALNKLLKKERGAK